MDPNVLTYLEAATPLTMADLADLCLPEQPPRDFAARVGHGRPHRRKITTHPRFKFVIIALGAVALPAFATPGNWSPFAIGDASDATSAIEPMPFERSGDSFPGSAFYYLELEAREPGLGEGIHSDAESSNRLGVFSGPTARPFYVDNSGIDRSRAEQCLTAAIYYEAASEADTGQRAVAQVVLNRVAHPAYPKTVCGVVFQGSERKTGCQFSFTCDGSLARRPSRFFWDRAGQVAREALSGYVHTPVGLATHYHTLAVNPYWAPSLHYLQTIGAHQFYSFKGSAGQQATFRFAYLGGEPTPMPHRPDNSALTAAASAAVDPLAIQKAYGADTTGTPTAGFATHSPAPTPAASASTPLYTTEHRERGGDSVFRANALPEVSGIREEYRNSGQWIADPTK